MEVVFLQWSHGLTTHTPRNLARLGREIPKPTRRMFSDMLKDVVFDMDHSIDGVYTGDAV